MKKIAIKNNKYINLIKIKSIFFLPTSAISKLAEEDYLCVKIFFENAIQKQKLNYKF